MQTSRKFIPHGFTLTELAISLAIIFLLLPLMFGVALTMMAGAARKDTHSKLSAAELSLAQFVATNKRLPCPADGSVGNGLEVSPCGPADVYKQENGVLPWVTLGLGRADVVDGWNNFYTYKVAPGLTTYGVLDQSMCDPAGTEVATVRIGAAEPGAVGAVPAYMARADVQQLVCKNTCTAVSLSDCTPPKWMTRYRGLMVMDVGGAITLMDPIPPEGYANTNFGGTGAAYVLISHGENQGGAIGNAGNLMGAVKTQVGLMEANNAANLAIRFSAPGSFYIDGDLNDGDNVNHFDDIVLRTTITRVVGLAHSGPRTH